ncbi:MAG TPA: DUF1854 domain-containing protein [Armatimonadota bacterium]|jgi:hypothetical protein
MTEESKQPEEEPKPATPANELRILQPAEVKFRREGIRLQLSLEGGEWQEVKLLRAFPLTEPEHWIAVLDKDGKEIGMLRDLRRLPAKSLAAAREELSQRYLVPQILRIDSCRARADVLEWTVETDRGPAVFLTRNLQESIKQPVPRRLTITDVEGNRFDVPDVDALDEDSRLLVSGFI